MDNTEILLDSIFDGLAGAEAPEFEDLPPGKYIAVIKSVEAKMSKNNKPMLDWTLQIAGGVASGKVHHHRNMLVTDQNFGFAKRDLQSAGLTKEQVSTKAGIAAGLPTLCGRCVNIEVVKNGEYLNTRINGPANVDPATLQSLQDTTKATNQKKAQGALVGF